MDRRKAGEQGDDSMHPFSYTVLFLVRGLEKSGSDPMPLKMGSREGGATMRETQWELVLMLRRERDGAQAGQGNGSVFPSFLSPFLTSAHFSFLFFSMVQEFHI
jgi:hypothetical protein